LGPHRLGKLGGRPRNRPGQMFEPFQRPGHSWALSGARDEKQKNRGDKTPWIHRSKGERHATVLNKVFPGREAGWTTCVEKGNREAKTHKNGARARKETPTLIGRKQFQGRTFALGIKGGRALEGR